jgi:hypothetical protein
MRVISIDPGKCTGYCYGAFKDGELYYYPFQFYDDVDDLWNRLAQFEPAHIVIEDFQFRKGRTAGVSLFSVELIGVARLYEARHHRTTLYKQQPAQGKGYYTDATLKSLGLYNRDGNDHARDATRHLLQWATFGPGYKYVGKTKMNDFMHQIGLEAFDLG